MKKVTELIITIVDKLGWKQLSGWARIYYASPYEGKIYSVQKSTGKLKELDCKPGANGYKTVKLKGTDGKYHTKSVHRLIANTFIPNPSEKKVCHHKNHKRTDNGAANLEWVTHKENSRKRKDNKNKW